MQQVCHCLLMPVLELWCQVQSVGCQGAVRLLSKVCPKLQLHGLGWLQLCFHLGVGFLREMGLGLLVRVMRSQLHEVARDPQVCCLVPVMDALLLLASHSQLVRLQLHPHLHLCSQVVEKVCPKLQQRWAMRQLARAVLVKLLAGALF